MSFSLFIFRRPTSGREFRANSHSGERNTIQQITFLLEKQSKEREREREIFSASESCIVSAMFLSLAAHLSARSVRLQLFVCVLWEHHLAQVPTSCAYLQFLTPPVE